MNQFDVYAFGGDIATLATICLMVGGIAGAILMFRFGAGGGKS